MTKKWWELNGDNFWAIIPTQVQTSNSVSSAWATRSSVELSLKNYHKSKFLSETWPDCTSLLIVRVSLYLSCLIGCPQMTWPHFHNTGSLYLQWPPEEAPIYCWHFCLPCSSWWPLNYSLKGRNMAFVCWKWEGTIKAIQVNYDGIRKMKRRQKA